MSRSWAFQPRYGARRSTSQLFGASTNPENFPGQFLAPELQEVILEIYRSTQAPIGFIATAMLGVITVASQECVRLRMKGGRLSSVNLWLLNLSDFGEQTDQILKSLLRGLEEDFHENESGYLKAELVYRQKKEIWDEKRKYIIRKLRAAFDNPHLENELIESLAVHDQLEPVKPVLKSLIHRNANPVALAKYTKDVHPETSLIASNIDDFARVSYLSGLKMLRAGYDKSSSIENCDAAKEDIPAQVVTLLLMGERLNFANLSKKGSERLMDSPFGTHFLVSSTERLSSADSFNWHDSSVANDSALEWFARRCKEIADHRKRHGSKKTICSFSPGAEAELQNYFVKINNECRCGEKYFFCQDYASGLSDKVARIATLLHFFVGDEGGISSCTLRQAIYVVDWFTDCYFHIFNSHKGSSIEQSVFVLRRWLYDKYAKGQPAFAKTYIRQSCPNKLRNIALINRILDELQRNGEILVQSSGPGQGVSVVVLPKLISVVNDEIYRGGVAVINYLI